MYETVGEKMNNHEVINGIGALTMACDAYRRISDDAAFPDRLEAEAAEVLRKLCCDNASLTSCKCLCNGNPDNSIPLGECAVSLPDNLRLSSTLRECLPNLVEDNRIVLKVRLDLNSAFTMVIESSDDTDSAAVLSQYILLSALGKKSNLSFRCADLGKGGGFFSVMHDAISAFPNKSGGMVYKTAFELTKLIDDLVNAATQTISALGHKYGSLAQYNEENQVKLTEYINILYISESDRNGDFDRLRILAENSRKNGVSTIIIAAPPVASQFADAADYYLSFIGKTPTVGKRKPLPFAVDESVCISQEAMDAIKEGLQRGEQIDTVFSHHPELKTEPITLDSSVAVRIPFALDRNGFLQYFEIGGDAPSHALVSGSTGSGKSVALHTLIMGMVYNYHPDDVEV